MSDEVDQEAEREMTRMWRAYRTVKQMCRDRVFRFPTPCVWMVL